MVWEDSYGLPSKNRNQYPSQPFKINERCFIRKDHKCNKIFGASKSCFIACPSEDDIEPILEIISMKLAKVGIEAIIAVKERAYGQDIFCTKICGKIIESKFCLVILNDLISENINIPNPNVYYEYGLMTSIEKHIIPLQKENLKLAFNIQSYDTIKYNSKNIGAELDRAIKDAIKISESKDQTGKNHNSSERSILRGFELAGFELKDENWFLANVIEDTDFKGFGQIQAGFYVFLGKIDKIDEMQTYLQDLNVIIHRIKKEYQNLVKRLNRAKEIVSTESATFGLTPATMYEYGRSYRHETVSSAIQATKEEIETKVNLISMPKYFGFIINPDIDRSDFITKAEELVSKNKGFFVVQDKDGEIIFGKVRVRLDSSNP